MLTTRAHEAVVAKDEAIHLLSQSHVPHTRHPILAVHLDPLGGAGGQLECLCARVESDLRNAVSAVDPVGSGGPASLVPGRAPA